MQGAAGSQETPQLRGMSMLLGDALSHSKRPSPNSDEAFIVLKVNRIGKSENAEEQIQILGMQENQAVRKEIQKQIGPIQRLVDCVFSQSRKAALGEHVGMNREEAERRIQEVVNTLVAVPSSSVLSSSILTNLLNCVVRLCFGEIMASTMWQVGAGRLRPCISVRNTTRFGALEHYGLVANVAMGRG